MFPQLARLSDFGFLLLRLMVGVVFITSGWNDLKDPGNRFTIFLAPPKWPEALASCSGARSNWRRSV